VCWALLIQSALFLRLGQADEAERRAEEGLRLADGETMKSEAICALCGLALARLLKGDDSGAFEAAERALVQARATKPVAYWLQGALAFLAEVLLSLHEKGWAPAPSSATVSKLADEAVEMLRRFAQQIPLARPHAHLWNGLAAHLAGKQARAHREWQKAVSLGSHFGLPYEVCRANFEIGRHRPAGDERTAILDEARAEFQRLGCAADLARMEHLAVERA